MQLLGRYNWWAPRWLDRLWRRIGLGVEERSPAEREGGLPPKTSA
jgi:hypothetical protein